MTSFSFSKNYASNTAALGVEQKVNGWIATKRTFAPAIDNTLAITGSIRGHASEKFSLNAPVASTAVLPGGVKGSVDSASLFTDFGHATIASTVDPAVSVVKTKTSGAAFDAAATGGFRRVSMSLTVPNDTSTQRRAAYVAPGVRVNGMAQNNGVNIDAVQVEVALNGATTPTAYEPARAIQVGVRPNRLNWGWSKSTTGWGVVAPTGGVLASVAVVANGAPDDGGAFMRVTCTTSGTATGGGAAFGTTNIDHVPVTPGIPYSFRTMLRTNRDNIAIQYLVRWYNAAGAQVGDQSAILIKTVRSDRWSEFKIEGVVPPDGAARAFITIYFVSGAIWQSGDTLDCAGMLIEQGQKVGTYFDGFSGNDYLWDQGGGAPGCRSYYYEDYAVRSYLLRQVLAENCPLGVIPAVPQFAVQPRF